MRKVIKHSVRFVLGPQLLGRRIASLVKQPIFLFITLWGHAVIAGGTFGLYYFEKDLNPGIHSLFDSLFWAVATVSTVGDSGIIPVTTHGKLLAMAVMIFGSLFLWSYTALFVTALVAPELRIVEDEVRNLETQLMNGRTKNENRSI